MFKSILKTSIIQHQKRSFYSFKNDEKELIIKNTIGLINIYIKGFILSTSIGSLYIYKNEYQKLAYHNPYKALFNSILYSIIPASIWPVILIYQTKYYFDK